ncbi:50S ribosomal protein L25/general stress protein Ctc [uncultured Aquitalea sp.]|uniref:50S ribosomal protein L25/general stress protein Ctc n=1 Tax=uncultured Aquitalea sp. TaxID=540272 RepID=UPI0025F076CF|nr:50S ribosomal protein L25/general stress protein Ctc [uncultured Aquitalea sp.]
MAYELIAAKREEMGTGASRRLRSAGKLPAVVYGNGAAESVVLDHNPIYYALKEEAFHSAIIDLVVDGAKQTVLLRDFQMHPYKQQVMHIDFQRVDLSQKVHVKIQLHFVGADVSEAVKLQGAKISHILNEVEVRALPGDLPKFIEVDLSNIKAGQTIHMSDLKLPAGVELTAVARGENGAVALAN